MGRYTESQAMILSNEELQLAWGCPLTTPWCPPHLHPAMESAIYEFMGSRKAETSSYLPWYPQYLDTILGTVYMLQDNGFHFTDFYICIKWISLWK